MRRLVLVPFLLAAACGTVATPRDDDALACAGRTVVQLVHAPYDAARHDATCKPWHRVFDLRGRQLTKDLGGLYPHHRGVFLGWNHTRCDGRSYDFWHCNHGETQRVVARSGGGDAPQVTAIDWLAADGTAIVHERRTLAVRSLTAATWVLELTSELRAAGHDVELGGDPQHAGCQFRADQCFAPAEAPKVGYVRPDGAEGGKDDVWTQCRWIAAVLPFADGPAVVLRVEHPDNPPATWSTRPYGRFGAMSTLRLTATAAQRLRYAYVVTGSLPDDAATAQRTCADLAAAAFRP